MAEARQPIESGVPDPFPWMHPALRKNYGKWKYHDRPRTGVLHHVAESGDEVWTVKAGTCRQLDVFTIRKLCDIADEYCSGFIRFTTRSNAEFMVTDEKKVAPLIERLKKDGFPVGGTGASISQLAHTQGWLHCDIPGTDASGVVKAVMDSLYEDFVNERFPAKVKINTLCCEINCGGHGDIDINVQHTKPPVINHDLVHKICERPTVIARCPVAAIAGRGQRPAVARNRREEVHVLRRLLSALPAHADQRSGQHQDRHLDRRQELQCPHQAHLPQAGDLGPAQQSAALARGFGRGEEDPRSLPQGRPAV